MTFKLRPSTLALSIALALPTICGAAAPVDTRLADWPRVSSAIKKDDAIEKRVQEIVSKMTLAQKVGQMTQPEIKTTKPEDVTKYYLGSVLNGGGSWPNNNKAADAKEWLALAQAYHEASMKTDMAIKVPVVWGTDAVHGHNNVPGATLFPHNIGLGAARNPQLMREIGAATAKAVRATGIAWVFGPTLAVVRDDRWGRTYESYAEHPEVVRSYAGEYVKGMQGAFKDDANTIATAKHFIGDGGTKNGKDRGVTEASQADLINIHGAGYFPALEAGAQTVMSSFNSWTDTASGKQYGKLHGSKYALTDILKVKMGFDGFVVTDWNGIGEVTGCRNDSCAQAINAGNDMIMVPDDWKAFIANTIKQVEAGEIPMSRIDDAVSRIIRVKLRAGLFDKSPAQNAHAGKDDAMQARALARQAVRESLVLLKNEGPALPLKRGQKILVVGKSADELSNQSGGWSITWQGTATTNADFKNADTILTGIREAAGKDNVTFSLDAKGVDVSKFDVVVAVIGERPYAEGDGDIHPSGTLRHSSRYPEDLAVLKAVGGKGKPVVTVMVTGRPVYANDLLNLSDTFISAWLPGSEGKGVSDLLVEGQQRHDFRGVLPFSWPKSACQIKLNVGDKDYAPLFAYGYGLKLGTRSKLGTLDESYPQGGCSAGNTFPVFSQGDRLSYPLAIRSGQQSTVLGADLNASFKLPNITVTTAQVNTQQDAKLGAWTGPATLEARGKRAMTLPAAAVKDGALRFDTVVAKAPAGKVTLSMRQGSTSVDLDATALFKRLAVGAKNTVAIPLACFQAKGLDLAKVDTPFAITSDAAFSAAFANIEIAGGAAKEAGAVQCGELK